VADANKNQTQDAKNALAEYEAQAQAVRAKTERLRALRLAREAAEPAAAAKRAVAGKAKAAKAAKGTSASLSTWLKDQQNSGRRT
jgi:hypothetical protein